MGAEGVKPPPLQLPTEQVDLIRATFASKIEPDVSKHALELYIKLLELIPEAAQMFSMTRRAKEPHRENKLLQAHATTAMKMVCSAAVKLDRQKDVRCFFKERRL
ncbi:hypothetical protein CLOM_g19241 [Closterium sp. NIES-68]|nr:hypothetical protein CLOM_g19241 [Closterium sp. NIES-68]